MLKSLSCILLFPLGVSISLLLVKLKTKRLKKKKRRFEKIVAERIRKLKEENRRLISQKDEMQARVKKLNRQNENLRKQDELKWQVINALVHDLKNPLTQILSASSSKSIKYLSRRMLMLITNMLAVEKYGQTELILTKEMFPIENIIDDVITGQEISLNEKNIKVKIKMDNVCVWADKEVLIRVFDNLLANAIRFSPLNQTIEIFVHYSRNRTVEVSVKNYGNTIPEKDLKRIFDKYTQVNTSNGNYRNIGIGLAFCRMALRAHGHTIKAGNFKGGVILSFTLDGHIVSPRKINGTIAVNNTIVLSDREKEMLNPWLFRLRSFEIYQSSDILNIVEDIPNNSKSIITLKQQIIDAVFSSNSELFSQLVGKNALVTFPE